MANFRRGAFHAASTSTFEPGMLPDSQKEMLCRELLSEFGVTSVTVRDNGEMIHSCPLPFGQHKNGDASASASLNFLKLTFNCFGCGASGGLLWFIATCRGEDTDQSRAWLADQTGTGPDEQSLSSLLEFFDAVYNAPSRPQAEPIPKMSPKVLDPWRRIHPYLTDPPEQAGRGIPVETILHFNVGYAERYKVRFKAPDGDPRADRDGMVAIESERIVIPHFWKGDLVGWQTRRLAKDGSAKYLSSPAFPKDTTIYNYDDKRREAVVVESPMSVLARYHHIPHIEGTFGAKMTDRQLRLISMHPRVILWLDPDPAGWTATKRAGSYLEPYCDVWVVDNPWNADAGDLNDVEVETLLNDALVPFSLWEPPTTLFCWQCKAEAHEGVC